jgi:hypothetical protein
MQIDWSHGPTRRGYFRLCFLPAQSVQLAGLRRPTNIGFLEFAASIGAAFGKNSPPFEAIFYAIQPIMEPWFNAVASNPQLFQILGRQFLLL